MGATPVNGYRGLCDAHEACVFTRANSTLDDDVNLLSLVYLVVFRVVYTVVQLCATCIQ